MDKTPRENPLRPLDIADTRLIMYPPMRDLSDEEDAAEAQRRITMFHLWMLSQPLPSPHGATALPLDGDRQPE